jgi:hypothetical protein
MRMGSDTKRLTSLTSKVKEWVKLNVWVEELLA